MSDANGRDGLQCSVAVVYHKGVCLHCEMCRDATQRCFCGSLVHSAGVVRCGDCVDH